MKRHRNSGVLLHVTSLPSEFGVGNFGQSALALIDFLSRTGQTLWQVLPFGPPGFGESPYQCFSAFAGNPLFVDPKLLAEQGFLSKAEIQSPPVFSAERVEFERVIPYHRSLLQRAFENYRARQAKMYAEELAAFEREQADWLEDYALFQAIKGAHQGVAWTSWEPEFRDRSSASLAHARQEFRGQIELEKFIQFQFFRQWSRVRAYAHDHGIKIIGDLPIFVAHDSADVWAHPELFDLRGDGTPRVVAGVPPDYFSATGQLWGNPIYRWERMDRSGYEWWVRRVRGALALFDQIRFDHFRGFESYWEIPGGAPTAAGGRWVPGPGAPLFEAIRKEIGSLPLIAEDLGVITPEVEELRDSLGLPGMRVLQFAFGDDPLANSYQPHNYPRNCIVYTGTHDNDTTVGWFHSQAGRGTTRRQERIDAERAFVLRYLGTDGNEIHWDMIRLALASVADTAIFPMQDLLGLGTEARMNLPGTMENNWRWRFRWEALTMEVELRLANLTATYERGPLPQKPK